MTRPTGRLQLWVFSLRGEARGLAVLCDRHAPEFAATMASLKAEDPAVSFERVHRADLIAALQHDERHGLTECVACGPRETVRLTAFHNRLRPCAAELVGRVAQA